MRIQKALKIKNNVLPYSGIKVINSGNQGENSNDPIVADRQKHNGMSWTNKGCASMGKIRQLIIRKNNGYKVFISNTNADYDRRS